MLRFAGRAVSIALAGAGLLWVAIMVPVISRWQEEDLSQVGGRVAVLQFFQPEILEALDNATSAFAEARPCRPAEREGRTLIRIERSAPYLNLGSPSSDDEEENIAEEADQQAAKSSPIPGQPATAPAPPKAAAAEDPARRQMRIERLAATHAAALMTLRCNPYSSLTWTILAFVETQGDNNPERILAYVDMSDLTGPREKLTILRRVELLLPLFDRLDERQKARLGQQIRQLAQERALFPLALFVIRATPVQATFLVEQLSQLNEKHQKRVATYIRRLGGYIDLPLVEPEGQRPWR